MSSKDFMSVVVDNQGQKFMALEGMVQITTLFGDPAKLAISQTMMVTAFGQRLVTTVWMFPYKKDKNTFEKVGYVGSTMLNPIDTFSYKQAVINALTDVGQSFLVRSAPKDSKRYLSFVRKYEYDTYTLFHIFRNPYQHIMENPDLIRVAEYMKEGVGIGKH